MIGTHNSLTYKPKHKITNLWKGFWKCQNRSVVRQCFDGVKFFDIRITVDERKYSISGGAHGVIDLHTKEELLQTLAYLDEVGYFRIVIERGSNYDEDDEFVHKLRCLKWLTEIRVKSDWKLLYKNPRINLNIIDMSFVPFHSDQPWWKEWKNIFKYPIKRWVKKHKTKLTKEQIEDPNTVYLVDYYQYYI